MLSTRTINKSRIRKKLFNNLRNIRFKPNNKLITTEI